MMQRARIRQSGYDRKTGRDTYTVQGIDLGAHMTLHYGAIQEHGTSMVPSGSGMVAVFHVKGRTSWASIGSTMYVPAEFIVFEYNGDGTWRHVVTFHPQARKAK